MPCICAHRCSQDIRKKNKNWEDGFLDLDEATGRVSAWAGERWGLLCFVLRARCVRRRGGLANCVLWVTFLTARICVWVDAPLISCVWQTAVVRAWPAGEAVCGRRRHGCPSGPRRVRSHLGQTQARAGAGELRRNLPMLEQVCICFYSKRR